MNKNKRNNKQEERYYLTPKACLGIALSNTGISDDNLLFEDWENKKFQSTYIVLEQRMNNAGYITDEDGKTRDNKDADSPEIIFARTIKGFYPKVTEEQIEAAWDLFVYHMRKQRNA